MMAETDKTAKKEEAGKNDTAAIEKIRDAYGKMRDELSKVIVGQDEVIEQLIIAIFSKGHCILEGVPGLAKTLLVSSLAQIMELSFKRIQFTPDLMPSDITGTEVIQDDPETGDRKFKFLPGPIFANVILADEINRTPPKTQAALLESMQERQVSIGGDVYKLKEPFFVLATQNPLEQEGTYPLPEAQQDRFLFKIFVDYPDEEEELKIIKSINNIESAALNKVLKGQHIVKIQKLIRRVPVADHIFNFANALVRATRGGYDGGVDIAESWLSWGAGPRATINLVTAARARAVLRGQAHVSTEDIKSVAKPVLRHRIAVNFAAQAEGYTPEKLIDMFIERVDESMAAAVS